MGSRTEPAAHQEFNVSKSKAGGQSMIMKLYLSWTALSAPRSRYSRSSADTSSTAAPARFLSAGMTSSPSTWDFWTILSKGSFKIDRKSTRLNSSHPSISYAVFCLKKKSTLDRERYLPCRPPVSHHPVHIRTHFLH